MDLPELTQEHKKMLVGMHPNLQEVIRTGIMLGWVAHDIGHTGVNMTSHDGEMSFVVPRKSQVNEKKWRAMLRKIDTYADPVKRLQGRMSVELENFTDEQIEEIRTMEVSPVPLPDEEPKKKRKDREERHVVSTKPWLAARRPNKSGGTRYESEAVTERTWSDGHVDYVCSYEGCNYNSTVARSVATHYGQKHVRHGDAPPVSEDAVVPDPDYTEPMSHRYNPTERLLAALAEYLDDYMAEGSTPEELARLFLTWAHDRPDLERVTRESVPLTDAQIVERVRMLVGDPSAHELKKVQAELETLKTTHTELQEELKDVRDDRDETLLELEKASKEIERLRGEWDALREIMNAANAS